MVFTTGSFSLVATLLYRGVGGVEVLSRVPWMVLPLLAGAELGRRLGARLPRTIFGRLIGALLVVTGLGLCLEGLG